MRGDVTHRAGGRARTKQRALRAAQHLDAVEVVQVEVGREQRDRDRRLVEVDADRFLHARLIADHLAGADAADGDLALARTQIRDVEAGHVARDVDDVGGAGLLDVLPVMAATEKGTSCNEVARFCAVTTMTSLSSSSVTGGCSCAEMASGTPNSNAAVPRDFHDFMRPLLDVLLCGSHQANATFPRRPHLLRAVSTSRVALRSGSSAADRDLTF